MEAVDQANQRQKRVLFERAREYYETRGGLSGRTFAIWGLSFKPRTDDMREAPSIDLIRALIAEGASVRAYDPEAGEVALECFKDEHARGAFQLCDQSMDCLDSADALFVVTEWRLFHHPDFDELKRRLKAPLIFDGRNIYDPHQMDALGFTYYGIGRGASVRTHT